MTSYSAELLTARTALFVPGMRPDRFEKARNSGADLVILDLEDSVLESDKDTALENVLGAISETEAEGCSFVVRVNSTRLDVELPKLVAASQKNQSMVGIVLPKAERAEDIPALPRHLSYVAIVESGLGLKNVHDVASHPQVALLAFGGMDFAAEMGSHSPVIHDYARAQILIASITAGKSRPWDSPSGHIQDLDVVLEESKHARDLGFGGKMVIHPAQISKVHEAFEVTQAEIDWARAVLATTEGASQVDGQMVDKPITLQAQGVLRRAGLSN